MKNISKIKNMDIVQRIFKSLAGKTRLDILLLLLEKEELTVNEISSILHRQVSTISRNLRILEKDNFVKARHTSRNVHYSIKKDKKYKYNLKILKLLKERLKEIKKFEKGKKKK
jgi:DNA-binding transcriptional ArsR family regulator